MPLFYHTCNLIFFTETPSWVKGGAQVDVLEEKDGIWYAGKIRHVVQAGDEVYVALSYPGYQPVQQKLSTCKYQATTPITPHLN